MRLTVNLLLLTATLLFFSCKKETEDYTPVGELLSDYLPLQVGKYITYRTDSLIFLNAGHSIDRHYSQEKHVIDAQVPDALGRPSYRVFRFLRDSAGTQPWTPNGTYYITPIVDSNTRLYSRIELIENNLRVIKLAKSVKQGQTWKGNQYLPTDPYSSLFGSNFNPDDDLNIWNFSVVSMHTTETIRGTTYKDVATVEPLDDQGNPINVLDNVSAITSTLVVDPNRLATAVTSTDKYAKGIGLIYQELTLWERQPTTNTTSAYYNGFSVIRRIIDHN